MSILIDVWTDTLAYLMCWSEMKVEQLVSLYNLGFFQGLSVNDRRSYVNQKYIRRKR